MVTAHRVPVGNGASPGLDGLAATVKRFSLPDSRSPAFSSMAVRPSEVRRPAGSVSRTTTSCAVPVPAL
ncbi:MAG: hypothetical protein ACKORL_11540, partial [Phycisphaerales bacterium]